VTHEEYIKRLTLAVEQLYECRALWIESVAVHELFRRPMAWKGTVEIFALGGHPKAKKAYAWGHPNDLDECFVTALEITHSMG
jgi:hypothetical protein